MGVVDVEAADRGPTGVVDKGLIASAYYYMNRADPDCGTTFSWVTRAMGPSWGWLGGWAIIVADVIVMANLAQIAGLYSFCSSAGRARPTRCSP